MHGYMAGDIVKDIGLGEIVERVPGTDRDGSGELAVTQTIEKQKCGNVAAHRFRLEAGKRFEKPVDVVQARDAGRVEAEGIDAGAKVRVGIAVPSRLHAGEELAPRFVI